MWLLQPNNARPIKLPLKIGSFATARPAVDGKASSENEMEDCSKRGAIEQQESSKRSAKEGPESSEREAMSLPNNCSH